MTDSLVLIEGKSLKKENLMISLANAKQVVVGSVISIGVILHVAANSLDDLSNALIRLAKVKDVTGVVTLTIRP